jgi:hypothetical protein
MNLFSWLGHYRSLPARLAESESARIKAEDDARFWRGKVEVWEQIAQKALDDKDQTFKLLVDWQSERMTGVQIFGTGPRLPREPLPGDREPEQPPQMGRRLMRDIVNEFRTSRDQALGEFARMKTGSEG